VLGSGFWVLGSGFWVLGGWWLVVGGWWLVVGGWWLVVGGWWLGRCDGDLLKLILVECAKREDYASVTLHDWLRSWGGKMSG